jgi:TIR domain
VKVFISWSGRTSNAVAVLLKDWLPLVIQSVVPYVSSEDIQSGSRWAAEVASELDQSAIGILCVTPGNIAAPWLNFEAGALSKSINRSRVMPFLFRMDRSDMPDGPLVQFQSVLATEDDVRRMVTSLNQLSSEQPLDEARLGATFDAWWPQLQSSLDQIPIGEETAVDTSRGVDDVLADVLDSVRRQERLLSEPWRLLPPAYVESVLSGRPLEAVNKSLFELKAATGMLSAALQETDAPDEVRHAAQAVVKASTEASNRLQLAALDEQTSKAVFEAGGIENLASENG